MRSLRESPLHSLNHLCVQKHKILRKIRVLFPPAYVRALHLSQDQKFDDQAACCNFSLFPSLSHTRLKSLLLILRPL